MKVHWLYYMYADVIWDLKINVFERKYLKKITVLDCENVKIKLSSLAALARIFMFLRRSLAQYNSGGDPFFGWGGGGGAKVLKWQKISARSARKVAISNFARIARRKNENFICLVVYFIIYVKFNGFVVHDSAFLTYSCITKTICLPPHIFIGPPQDRRLCNIIFVGTFGGLAPPPQYQKAGYATDGRTRRGGGGGCSPPPRFSKCPYSGKKHLIFGQKHSIIGMTTPPPPPSRAERVLRRSAEGDIRARNHSHPLL